MMHENIQKMKDLLPEYIDLEYPKGSEGRGQATVEIVNFLLWVDKHQLKS